MTMPLRVTPITRSFTGNPLTPLERVLSNSADRGDCYGGRTQITGGLEYMAHNIKSAFVLVEKATLPEVALSSSTSNILTFSFSRDSNVPFHVSRGCTSDRARRIAAKWLAIAAYLEAEEKAKEKADAEAAKVAEAAAKNARQSRLNDIADLYFGKDFDELGDNKASAVKEIYRLEEKLADEAKDAA